MPVAPTMDERLRRRALFMLFAGCRKESAPRLGLPRRGSVRRPQHAAAAALAAAAAGEDRIDIGRIVGLARDLVVVGELLARLDGAQCVDEHAAALDHRLAVRLTGMIDEARLVA